MTGSCSTYYAQHRETLDELLAVLGEPRHRDPASLVAWMERRWLGAEHGPGAEKPSYLHEAVMRAWPLLQRLDLVDRVEPARRTYDEVVVLGAAGIGLYRRLGLVRSSGVSAPLVSLLAGQRPHSRLARDGDAAELLDRRGRFAAADGWTPPAELLATERRLAAEGVSPLAAAAVLFPSETDLARLHVFKHWPTLKLVRVDEQTGPQEVLNELGPRAYVWEHYRSDDPVREVRILNAAPVRRVGGDGGEYPARPTSLSSLREWAAVVAEAAPTSVTSMLFVVNQPHLTRVALDVRRVMGEFGIEAEIDVAGCEVLRESVDINLVLGEIPARINADLSSS